MSFSEGLHMKHFFEKQVIRVNSVAYGFKNCQAPIVQVPYNIALSLFDKKGSRSTLEVSAPFIDESMHADRRGLSAVAKHLTIKGRVRMVWQTVPGVKGKVYCPEASGQSQKHVCADCFGCLHCSEARCRLCRCEQAVRIHSNPEQTIAGRTAPKER